VLLITFKNLLLVECSVAVLVHGLENLLKVLLLLLAGEVRSNEGQSGLLDLLVTSKILQVGQGLLGDIAVHLVHR